MGIKLVRFISSERVRLILSALVLHPSIRWLVVVVLSAYRS